MLLRPILFSAVMSLSLTVGASTSQRAVLDVKGMTCASCPITVKIVLKRQPGVEDVKMDAERNTAEVRFDPAKVSPDQLARAVSEAGFATTARK